MRPWEIPPGTLGYGDMVPFLPGHMLPLPSWGPHFLPDTRCSSHGFDSGPSRDVLKSLWGHLGPWVRTCSSVALSQSRQAIRLFQLLPESHLEPTRTSYSLHCGTRTAFSSRILSLAAAPLQPPAGILGLRTHRLPFPHLRARSCWFMKAHCHFPVWDPHQAFSCDH